MPHAFAELSQFTVDPASVRLLPRPWCLQHDVVVLGEGVRHRRDPGARHP
jgi:hypothetical protein